MRGNLTYSPTCHHGGMYLKSKKKKKKEDEVQGVANFRLKIVQNQ
jgi:hypothetical protein